MAWRRGFVICGLLFPLSPFFLFGACLSNAAVESRLLSSNDLVTEKAIYHKASCLSKTSVYEKPGRPVNTEMFNGFEAICAWLEEEGDCDLHTINELQEQIKLMGYECYSNKRLKQKLKEKY